MLKISDYYYYPVSSVGKRRVLMDFTWEKNKNETVEDDFIRALIRMMDSFLVCHLQSFAIIDLLRT